MPRLDFFAELHPGLDPYALDGLGRDPDSADDPELSAYRSGFWGIARIPAGAAACASRSRRDSAAARRSPSSRASSARASTRPRRATGATRPVSRASRSAWPPTSPPTICFAASWTRSAPQTHRNWPCVISDDCSSPERSARSSGRRAAIRVSSSSRSPRRLGFYRNFERALALAPPAPSTSRSPTRTTAGIPTSSSA